VVVNGNQLVTAVLERDLDTVNQDTSIPDVIEKIDQSKLQRITVTDGQGKFLGLIFARDLLPLFTELGVGQVLLGKLTFTGKGRRLNKLTLRRITDVSNLGVFRFRFGFFRRTDRHFR
jgi:CBS-domain-containing membrane protein